MQVTDIPQVSHLERRCYALPWNASAYATEIGNSIAYYTVAKDSDGLVVGFAGMWVIMDEIHITTLAVDPDVRGKSVGERLLLDMLEAGMERGAHRATLEVRKHNLAAHNLYLKYGFEDVAIRKKYYSDNGGKRGHYVGRRPLQRRLPRKAKDLQRAAVSAKASQVVLPWQVNDSNSGHRNVLRRNSGRGYRSWPGVGFQRSRLADRLPRENRRRSSKWQRGHHIEQMNAVLAEALGSAGIGFRIGSSKMRISATEQSPSSGRNSTQKAKWSLEPKVREKASPCRILIFGTQKTCR